MKDFGDSKCPCRISTAMPTMGDKIKESVLKLRGDGLNVECFFGNNSLSLHLSKEPATQLGRAIKAISNVMKKAEHSIHRGSVYSKYPEGKVTLSNFRLFCCSLTF